MLQGGEMIEEKREGVNEINAVSTNFDMLARKLEQVRANGFN